MPGRDNLWFWSFLLKCFMVGHRIRNDIFNVKEFNVKIVIYLLTLILCVIVFFLNRFYTTKTTSKFSLVSHLNSFLAIFTFSILSWLHFFMPELGSKALAVLVWVLMILFLVTVITDYLITKLRPPFLETVIITGLAIINYYLIFRYGNQKVTIDHFYLYLMMIPPLLLGGYVFVVLVMYPMDKE